MRNNQAKSYIYMLDLRRMSPESAHKVRIGAQVLTVAKTLSKTRQERRKWELIVLIDISIKFCHTNEYTLDDVKRYANREYAEHEYDGMDKSAYTELVALAYIYALYYRDDDSVTLDKLIIDAATDVAGSAPETLLIQVEEDYVPYWNEQIDLHNQENRESHVSIAEKQPE